MFKDRLREAMEIRELNATDLAKLAGIPKSTVSYYLSGRMIPKSHRIYDLAHALHVQEAWLLGYDVSMDRPNGKQEMLDEISRMYDILTPDEQAAVLATIRAFLSHHTES